VPNQSGKGTGDLDVTKDVAWWQHVNFSAISFGAEGLLDPSNQPATIAAIKVNTQSWPNLTQPNNPVNPPGNAAGAVAVDDLWHATAMARGSFVFAKSPTEVSYGLANILAGIQNQRKSRSGGAFNGLVLDATNSIIFVPTIEPGWAGDLLKVQIDPTSGLEVATWWQAKDTLAAQLDPVATGVAEPWMDEAHRRVVTLTGSTGPGVPFRHANLNSAQKLSLAPAPAGNTTQQQKLVSYLRGGNTYTSGATTTVIEGTGIGQFRKRFGPLGDISNAQPLFLGPPDRNYEEISNPGYAAFIGSAAASRKTVVIAPANDGMVHVFDTGPMPSAGPPAVAAAAGGGNEIFAFIPKALFRGVAGNLATEDVTAIQSLAYQDGGIPIYHHHMMVDSSPRAADVDFLNGGAEWHTIVVGGLGKGGNSYYALDLTNPNATDEATAAAKVLWEWSNSEVRYSYGRPVIVKVRDSAYPTGRWVVVVTGGYNNVSGLGKVFFLDAKDGTLLSTVTTSAGSATNPSGLAQTHAFVKNQNNQVAEQIYGGDLLGNFWRIDVSAVDQYKTASAVLFAELTDPSGVVQPITTAPQIEIDINNGIDRYVFIGTGRLLDNTDLTTPASPQTQTMYAIRDGTLQNMSTTGLPIQPRTTMSATNPDGVSSIVGGAPNGWYHDLPNVSGDAQRIVTDVQSNVNIAQYIGTRVQDDPCLISLPANLYARDYTTARSLVVSSGTVVSSIYLPKGAASAMTVGRTQADGTQTLGVLVFGEIPGILPFDLQNPVVGQGSRLSWRLLGVE
jgi:type IV pilus assembly protein PilY1